MAKGFILGLIVAFVLLIAGGYFFITTGALPAGQDSKPGKLETWAAKTSLSATINRETKGLTSPLQPTESNLTAGANLYVANCQVCHGGPDANATSIAKGLTPDPLRRVAAPSPGCPNESPASTAFSLIAAAPADLAASAHACACQPTGRPPPRRARPLSAT